MAPQLTGIKGPLARLEDSCNARATNFLPVPLPPRINTVDSLGPTISMSVRSSSMAALWPIIFCELVKNNFSCECNQ